jgi:type VI secretion system protein ImpK
MRLSDCFMDLFAYVSHALSHADHFPPSGEALCQTVSDLIDRSETLCEEGGVNRAHYEKARFAVFAWIDETVLKSDFEGKGIWQRKLLQRTYYQTTGGGIEFYSKLDDLEEEEGDVREVFFLCLTLGFSGRFGSTLDDAALRTRIREQHFKRLAGPVDLLSKTATTRLFPQAYSQNIPLQLEKPARKVRSLIMTLVLGAGPAMVFLFLYVLYRFILNNEIMTKVVH